MSAVADSQSDRLTLIKQQYPKIKVSVDYLDLMNDPNVHAIVIATPLSTHFEIAKQALMKGKHVFVEKPLTRTTQEALELIKLSEDQGKVLMVDHTFVYNNAIRKMKEIIDSGGIGDIYYIDSTRAHWDFGIFRHQNNVIWDLAPHDFSIVNFLTQQEPSSLTATGICCKEYSGDNHIESVAYVTLNTTGGILAHFHLSWLSPLKIRRFLIVGSRKLMVFDLADAKSPIKVYDKRIKIKNLEDAYKSLLSQDKIGEVYEPEIVQAEPLETECRHFIDCIENNKIPLTNGREGLKVVKLLEAAQTSLLFDGKRVNIAISNEKVS
jgi:predicted dehydrogenase